MADSGSASLSRERWAALCERLRISEPAARFDRLERAYAEPHRKYHDARHIRECLELFDSLVERGAFPDEIEFALWMHDVVYRTRRSDNEEQSAAMALGWLEASGSSPEAMSRVRDLVLVTTHEGTARTPDEKLIGDIDLHILGAPRERFDEYEEQIRSEYRWVPSSLFRRRRAEILRRFLARDPLFSTAECRARFEEAARGNLRRALQRLAR